MELAKLHRYFRVERSSFLKEHFCSRRNSLYLIEKGVFEYTVNGQTYQAAKGDCVFYKKGYYYDRAVLSPVVLHIFDIDCASMDVDAPISFLNRQRICSNIALLSDIDDTDKKNLPYVEHLLNDILFIYQQENAPAQHGFNMDDKRITQALSIIRNHFDKDITVSEVAKAVHLSYPQFNRLFVKNIGITPGQYIHRLRVDKAKALLYTTDLPIKAVAAECGFQDIYYFSNFFKSTLGVSPTEYRASTR